MLYLFTAYHITIYDSFTPTEGIMKFFSYKFYSHTLRGEAPVNLFIPDTPTADMPVLYLLHGMYGNQDSWGKHCSFSEIAEKYGLAVIMPYAANSFYCNTESGISYEDFIVNELPELIAKHFPISKKREKIFIMGFSMGGYGAFKLALNHPGHFSGAASISGCLDIVADFEIDDWDDCATDIWGRDFRKTVPNSSDDLLYLIDSFPVGTEKPKLYFCCGTEDFLYGENQSFLEKIKGKSFDYIYEEGPGTHDWNFVTKWCSRALCAIIE